MQCKCGGMTSDHEVVRNKEVVGRYVKCTSCGYVSWLKQDASLKEEIAKERKEAFDEYLKLSEELQGDEF